MKLNQDCARTILLHIEKTSTMKPNGTMHHISVRDLIKDEALSEYSREDILLSCSYLAQSKLLCVAQKNTSPIATVITDISALGRDYLSSIRNPKLWDALKRQFGDITTASISQIIAASAQFVASSLFPSSNS